MLRLVLVTLFVLVEAEEFLGVNYSFDVNFYSDFNNKGCDRVNNWRLVRYEALDIEPPYKDSDKAIQAVGESCSSSFPIIFIGGTLEINVYSESVSQMFNLRIEVFDKDDVRVLSYVLRRSRKDFGSGWQTILLKIDKHIEGYIHFRGRTLKNEVLLIDSFQYTPNNTISHDEKRSKRSITDTEDKNEDEVIFNYTFNNNNDIIESSGDDGSGTEEPNEPTEQPPVEPQEINTFWNPFTVSLVSFGVVVVVAMLVVGAYHYGKVRAANIRTLSYLDEEPPRTITIPRVTGVSNRSSRLMP